MTKCEEKVVVNSSMKQKSVKIIVGILILCGMIGLGLVVKHKLNDLTKANGGKCEIIDTNPSEIAGLLKEYEKVIATRKEQISGIYKSDIVLLTLNKDFTYSVIVKIDENNSVTQSGMWTFDGDKLKLSDAGSTPKIYKILKNKIDMGNNHCPVKIKLNNPLYNS